MSFFEKKKHIKRTDKEKKEVLPNEWPAQKKTVPIATPPKGMWYNPKVKEGKGSYENKQYKPSINDALKYFIENPEKYGVPASFDLKKKVVLFSTGKSVSFDEVIDNYMKDSGKYKEGDANSQWGKGLMDSPRDVGKEPSGDFPSSQWLPRGTEDMSVDEDIITGDLGLSALDKEAISDPVKELSPFVLAYLEAALWSTNDNMDEQGVEPLDSNYSIIDLKDEFIQQSIKDSDAFLKEAEVLYGQGTHGGLLVDYDEEQVGHDFWLTRNGHGAGFWDGKYGEEIGKKLTDLSKKFGEVNLDTYDMKNPKTHVTDDTVEDLLEETPTLDVDEKRDYLLDQLNKETDPTKRDKIKHLLDNLRYAVNLGISHLDKVAESYLTQNQRDQIAAKYGSEYISALEHYFNALSDGHPEDRASEYAINEMRKVDQTILPGTLFEISEIYMSGT